MKNLIKSPQPTKFPNEGSTPMKTKTDFPNKPFEMITSFLTLPRKKERQPSSDKYLADKASLTLITQILGHSSSSQARKISETLGNLVYTTLNEFSKEKHLQLAISKFLNTHRSRKGRKIFTISEPSLKRYTDTLRPQILDRYLDRQVDKLSQKSAKLGFNRKEIALAIDPTVKEYKGKFPNQCQPKGYVGQQAIYGKAYSEQAIYDSTNQYIVSTTPKKASGSKYKRNYKPHWISELQSQIDHAISRNQSIKVIYGDREYYSGIGNAMAYLSWQNPVLNAQNSPRLCVPRKLYNKIQIKKDFLLDPTSSQVFKESIELNYYHQGCLSSALNQFHSNRKNTRYQIPIWVVATFDAYSNRKKKRNLNWARNKTQNYQNSINQATKKLNQAITIYDRFCKSLPREYKGKKTKFRGKRRRVFKFPAEKPLYQDCCKWWDAIKRWKSKLLNLLKRLMFFVVSHKPTDCPKPPIEELIEISEGYHQRWGVESAFRSVKGYFWIPCQKRSLQARHARFILSCVLFNAWHYSRISRFKNKSQYSAKEIRAIKRWKKTEEKQKMRKLIQSESARAFLVETWSFGLKSLLKRQIHAK